MPSNASGSSRGSSSTPPIGAHFGRWVVVGEAPRERSREMWVVICVCGTEAIRQASSLRAGTSAGCTRCADHSGRRKYANRSRENGRHTREYKAYRGMLERCYDARSSEYRRYGGRGIGVCDAWRDSFDVFVRDAGLCPGAGYSIDRIDNERGYEPGNVRWATAKEQARNTRRNRVLEVDGRAQCVAAWAEELGVAPQMIFKRLAMGWSERDAVLLPPGAKRAA